MQPGAHRTRAAGAHRCAHASPDVVGQATEHAVRCPPPYDAPTRIQTHRTPYASMCRTQNCPAAQMPTPCPKSKNPTQVGPVASQLPGVQGCWRHPGHTQRVTAGEGPLWALPPPGSGAAGHATAGTCATATHAQVTCRQTQMSVIDYASL